MFSKLVVKLECFSCTAEQEMEIITDFSEPLNFMSASLCGSYEKVGASTGRRGLLFRSGDHFKLVRQVSHSVRRR